MLMDSRGLKAGVEQRLIEAACPNHPAQRPVGEASTTDEAHNRFSLSPSPRMASIAGRATLPDRRGLLEPGEFILPYAKTPAVAKMSAEAGRSCPDILHVESVPHQQRYALVPEGMPFATALILFFEPRYPSSPTE
jgi:hypothetical protein